jgi:hypothetical protein
MPLPVFVSETLHHEAIDWATRVDDNGGVISSSVIHAVSDFCAAIDRDGLRDRFLRLSIFSGGNLSGALVPLYRSTSFGGTVIGNATDTNINFVSADFSETGATGGLKGNGSNKYLNTGFTPAMFANTANVHLSYSGTSLETTSGGAPYALGSYTGAEPGIFALGISLGLPTDRRATQLSNISALSVSSVARGSTEAHMIGTRTATNAAAMYGAGSLLASVSSTVTTASSSAPMFVFCRSTNNTPIAFTSGRLRMYSIGNGLTAAQAAAFSAAVIALNNDLGR